MSGLSETTQALIDEAYRIAQMPSASGYRDLSDTLARIADTGELLAIPRIISLVLDRRPAIAEAAGTAIAKLHQQIAVRDVGLLDRVFRSPVPFHPARTAWWQLQPTDLDTVATLVRGPLLLSLAMCHPSGYIREAAIRRSAVCADGSEIPFLVIRANDWVAQVRDAAQAALRARLRPDGYCDLIAALPAIDQMRAWQRLGGASVIDAIDAWFAAPDAVAPLLAATASSDRFVRGSAYRYLFASSYADQRSVLTAALDDPDPEIRLRTARRLLDAGRPVFLAWSAQLLTSSAGAIRCRAAQRLHELAQPFSWQDLLLDRHAGVRAVAQPLALDAGVDPIAAYRAHISAGTTPALPTALLGLSETGGISDLAIVKPFLGHARPSVRCAALRGLAGFHAEDLAERCLAALLDPSPSVNRTARDLLLARCRSVLPATAWASFVSAPATSGKTCALAVLARLSYWDALPYLLRAFIDSAGNVRTAAAAYLARWLARQNRVFTAPSAATVAQIRDLVESPGLDVALRGELRAVLANRAT